MPPLSRSQLTMPGLYVATRSDDILGSWFLVARRLESDVVSPDLLERSIYGKVIDDC